MQFIDLTAGIFVTITMLTLIFQFRLGKLFPIDFWKLFMRSDAAEEKDDEEYDDEIWRRA